MKKRREEEAGCKKRKLEEMRPGSVGGEKEERDERTGTDLRGAALRQKERFDGIEKCARARVCVCVQGVWMDRNVVERA